MIKRISKFRALTGQEQKLLLTACLLLPLFWMGLRAFGLARLQTWLHRSPAIDCPQPSPTQVSRIADLVGLAANRGLVRASCLTRSLLLEWLLRRHGLESELRIGVRLNHGSFDAHAWLECGGIPINDAPGVAAQFAPFPRFVAFDLPGKR